MFSLSDVQQIIDEKYVDEINEVITTYVESLAGEELADIFDFSADFVECEVTSDAKVVSNNEDKYDGQIEISGNLEVGIKITGYVHWDSEDIAHDAVEKNAVAMFSFYFNKEKFEDFQIVDIYL